MPEEVRSPLSEVNRPGATRQPKVLVGDTPTGHTRPGEEQDDADLFEIGGVDGTRTRDLRRDRRKE